MKLFQFFIESAGKFLRFCVYLFAILLLSATLYEMMISPDLRCKLPPRTKIIANVVKSEILSNQPIGFSASKTADEFVADHASCCSWDDTPSPSQFQLLIGYYLPYYPIIGWVDINYITIATGSHRNGDKAYFMARKIISTAISQCGETLSRIDKSELLNPELVGSDIILTWPRR